MSRPLHPDVALGVHLSAICSRNRYTRDSGPVIAELLAVAGDRGDVLAYEVGRWAGYYDDEHTAVPDVELAREWAYAANAWLSDVAPTTSKCGKTSTSSRTSCSGSSAVYCAAST